MLYATKYKDPRAALDYQFLWGQGHAGDPPWLQPGETIQSETITVSPSDLTVESTAITNGGTAVTVWLSQGTVGVTYTVSCLIVTNESRTDNRSMTIVVQNR